jgi:hypothetical protein
MLAELTADDGSAAFRNIVASLRTMASVPVCGDILPAFREELVVPEAIARAENGQAGWATPEILRAQAVVMLKESWTANSEPAEAILLRSLAVAQEQEALSLQLRTAMTLTRLYLATGRRTLARQTLPPVYDRFAEGFGTADLRNAATLLATL